MAAVANSFMMEGSRVEEYVVPPSITSMPSLSMVSCPRMIGRYSEYAMFWI